MILYVIFFNYQELLKELISSMILSEILMAKWCNFFSNSLKGLFYRWFHVKWSMKKSYKFFLTLWNSLIGLFRLRWLVEKPYNFFLTLWNSLRSLLCWWLCLYVYFIGNSISEKHFLITSVLDFLIYPTFKYSKITSTIIPFIFIIIKSQQ
jgi:small-conductance mechanosensitive channel